MLHVYVSDLNRLLPEGILVTTPPGYMLRVPTGPSISPTSSASYPRVRSAAAADAGQRASRSERPYARLICAKAKPRIRSVCSKIDEGQL